MIAQHYDPSGVDAIVYAVGNCPPGGFDAEVSVPLTEICYERIVDEFDRQVTGLLNVTSYFLDCLKPGGHITVIGSAITRLTDDKCPSWLHAGHYAVAKAAQKELVVWLRRDPVVKEKKILIHYLAPAAVDTPFHRGCIHQPPVMLSVVDVAKRVLETFQSEVIIDEMMVPAAPAQ